MPTASLRSLLTGRANTAPSSQLSSPISTPSDNTIRSTAVVSLYSNAMAYEHFGYGASKGDGGYLHQGFNNLSWLPDPPASASGPIPIDS